MGGLGLGLGMLGGSGWTPAQQSGLIARGDANVASSITLNGSNVAQWNDLTGGGSNMVQATGAKQPAFISDAGASVNHNPSVRMTLTGTTFVLGTLASQYTGSTLTAIMIGITSYGAAAGSSRIIAAYKNGSNDFDNTTSAILFQSGINTNLSIFRNLAGPSQTITSTAGGLAGVWSMRFDNVNMTERLSGTDVGSTASSGAFAINNFLFGCGADSTGVGGSDTFQTQTDVCEWAFINHALSTTEWAQWSVYTTARYGLAA